MHVSLEIHNACEYIKKADSSLERKMRNFNTVSKSYLTVQPIFDRTPISSLLSKWSAGEIWRLLLKRLKLDKAGLWPTKFPSCPTFCTNRLDGTKD